MQKVEHLAKENKELHQAVIELTVLNDIATTITSIQTVEEVMDQIVLKCIKHLGVEEGTISLLDKENSTDQFHTMIRRNDSKADRVPINLDNRLKGWMLSNHKMLFSNDIRTDDRFSMLSEDSFTFHSIVCVPLVVKGNLIGYLAVFNKKDGHSFTDQDRRLLSIIGSQSAQVIENARLYEGEKALLSLQEEMRMARDIQIGLLPNHEPEVLGFQISATNLPAKSVGGDYYDFITLSSNKLSFCIGDITGKGMPAAMLMANLQATLRSQIMVFEDCINCIKGTNKQLYRSTEPSKFATLFYGILDPAVGRLEYVNGGHDAPLLFRKNSSEPELLHSTGLLLGVLEETEYLMESVTLQPGDVLVLFTDGITEAMNAAGEEFGLENLIDVAKNTYNKPPSEIVNAILSAVKLHANKTPQSDDITLMVIKKCN